MSQMSGARGEGKAGFNPCCSLSENFVLALELLSGCGMILKSRLLKTSPANGRCHGPLSFRVHPSSVICCNDLNLSRGSRV